MPDRSAVICGEAHTRATRDETYHTSSTRLDGMLPGMHAALEALAKTLGLGALLEELRLRCGSYEIVDHWQQGEFHHDLVVRVERASLLPGSVLVVATNCNGGVKEVLCFDDVPDRWGLWRLRCPEVEEFEGELPRVLASARTVHWFDPCELLAVDARSELLPSCRKRARGGGWEPVG